MFPLNMQNDLLRFMDIKLEHLPRILKWYNKVDEFKYATGIDTEITLQELHKKYAEVAICSNEFFTGIYTCHGNELIGILKGRVRYENRDAVWISSIVIDTEFQGAGYGTAALELLLGYLKKYYKIKTAYLAVVEENTQGRAFWDKMDFKEIRVIENHFKLNDRHQDVIILGRQL